MNYLSNPRPAKLGNFYCFWYNEKNEPRITLGPDWLFSLIEVALVNSISGYFLYSANSHGLVFYLGLLVVFL